MFISKEWKTLPAVKKGSYEQKVQQKMKDYTKALNMLTGFFYLNYRSAKTVNVLFDNLFLLK